MNFYGKKFDLNQKKSDLNKKIGFLKFLFRKSRFISTLCVIPAHITKMPTVIVKKTA